MSTALEAAFLFVFDVLHRILFFSCENLFNLTRDGSLLVQPSPAVGFYAQQQQELVDLLDVGCHAWKWGKEGKFGTELLYRCAFRAPSCDAKSCYQQINGRSNCFAHSSYFGALTSICDGILHLIEGLIYW